MLILKAVDKKTRETALSVLKQGGLIVSPSDTVYGLLVDATNEQAVKKLIQFKNRPWGKPISVFIADLKMLSENVTASAKQTNLIKELFPGPFTIILRSKHQVAKLLESEKGSLGIRIPNYRFLNELVKKFNKPITATSANLSGRTAHYSVQSLINELPDSKIKLIDLIIDGGQLPRNKPSTVIDLTESKLKIVRKGDIVFDVAKKYFSESPAQTKKIAQYIFRKFLSASSFAKTSKDKQRKPLIFILQGELGAGKTIFVKGIAELLGIEKIVSPTFVIYYEYPSTLLGVSSLIHIDLYNIEDSDEFKYLGLEKYLKPQNILCFEWGEKAGEIIEQLKSRGKLVYIKMDYIDNKTREIQVNF